MKCFPRICADVAVPLVRALLLTAWGVAVFPVIASADTVRVTKDQATIRLNPETTSAAITQVQAGTVLEVNTKHGSWYVVTLPPDSQGLRRSGYIAADDVERFEASQVAERPRQSPPAGHTVRPPSLVPPTSSLGLAPDWQSRYDAALNKRNARRNDVVGGTVLNLIGSVFFVLYEVKTDTVCAYVPISPIVSAPVCVEQKNPKYAWAEIAFMGAGIPLVIWGRVQYNHANNEVAALEAERARSLQGRRLEQSIVAVAGPYPSLAYKLGW